MGTSVLTPTFRYHPAIVAQAFATLGCLFPDRVVLGMGTGESMNEVPLGIEWPDGKERFARFREAVRLIRELWSERAGHLRGRVLPHRQGDHLRPARAAGADLPGRRPARPRPATPGGQGDGYITTSGKDPALYTDTLLPAVARGRREGRPRRSPTST